MSLNDWEGFFIVVPLPFAELRSEIEYTAESVDDETMAVELL